MLLGRQGHPQGAPNSAFSVWRNEAMKHATVFHVPSCAFSVWQNEAIKHATVCNAPNSAFSHFWKGAMRQWFMKLCTMRQTLLSAAAGMINEACNCTPVVKHVAVSKGLMQQTWQHHGKNSSNAVCHRTSPRLTSSCHTCRWLPAINSFFSSSCSAELCVQKTKMQ